MEGVRSFPFQTINDGCSTGSVADVGVGALRRMVRILITSEASMFFPTADSKNAIGGQIISMLYPEGQ